jgi:hypothetical protein
MRILDNKNIIDGAVSFTLIRRSRNADFRNDEMNAFHATDEERASNI